MVNSTEYERNENTHVVSVSSIVLHIEMVETQNFIRYLWMVQILV